MKKIVFLLIILTLLMPMVTFADLENGYVLDFESNDWTDSVQNVTSATTNYSHGDWIFRYPAYATANKSEILTDTSRYYDIKGYIQGYLNADIVGQYTYSMDVKAHAKAQPIPFFIRSSREKFLPASAAHPVDFHESDKSAYPEASGKQFGSTGIYVIPAYASATTLRVYIKVYDASIAAPSIGNVYVDLDASAILGEEGFIESKTNITFNDDGEYIKIYVNKNLIGSLHMTGSTTYPTLSQVNKKGPSTVNYFSKVDIIDANGAVSATAENTLVCLDYSIIGIGSRGSTAGIAVDNLNVTKYQVIAPATSDASILLLIMLLILAALLFVVLKLSKKYKKYAFTVLIVAVLVFAFSSCTKSEKKAADPTQLPATSLPTATTAATPTPNDIATSVPTNVPTPSPMPTLKPTVEPGKETYAGGIEDADNRYDFSMKPSDGQIAGQKLIESISIQFFATVSFDKLKISCVSYSDSIGTIDFNLYKWMGSYDDTFREENKAVYTYSLVDFKDNSSITLETGLLPDGEYILSLTSPDPFEGVGIYVNKDATVESHKVFIDDEYDDTKGAYFTIGYTKTPVNKYGPMQSE